jgi:hypothetical protein
MDPIKIKLQCPVEYGSETISELVISREPEVGDFRDMPADPRLQTVGHSLDLIGKLSGQPPSVMNKIKPKDLPAITEVFDRFF